MRTIGERLQQLFEVEGYSQTAAAQKTGIGQSQISELLTGKRNLGINTAKKILKAIPDANLNWIFFEIGNMKISEESYAPTSIREPSQKYNTDPMEKVFENYLQRDSIKKVIETIAAEKCIQVLAERTSEKKTP